MHRGVSTVGSVGGCNGECLSSLSRAAGARWRQVESLAQGLFGETAGLGGEPKHSLAIHVTRRTYRNA